MSTNQTLPTIDVIADTLDAVFMTDDAMPREAYAVLVAYAAGDRAVIARSAYAVTSRGVVGVKSTDTLTRFAADTGRNRSTLSAYATAYGWLVESQTPQTSDTFDVALKAYNDGKAGRARIRKAIPVIAALPTDAKRVAEWKRLRSATAADAKAARAGKSPDAGDGANVTTTGDMGDDAGKRVARPAEVPATSATDILASLRTIAKAIGVDSDTADVALTHDQASEVFAIATAIAETVAARETVGA
jgi:hypothetical protein